MGVSTQKLIVDSQVWYLYSPGIKAEEMSRFQLISDLGHPIGATATMRLITLIYEIRRRGARYGLEPICGGGGQGICTIVEAK